MVIRSSNRPRNKKFGGAGPDPVSEENAAKGTAAPSSTTNTTSLMFQYAILASTAIFVGVMLYYFSKDPAALTGRTYLYVTVLFVVLFSTAIYAYRGGITWSKGDGGGVSIRPLTLLIGGVVMVLVTLFVYLYTHASAAFTVILTFFLNMVLFLMMLLALVFLGNVATNYLKRTDGVFSFLLEFIFYIPCLLSAGAQGLWADWKMTPPLSAVILAVELLLILTYLYVPLLIQTIVTPSGAIVLQGPPVFLDQGAVTVGTSEAARTSANSTVANNILPQGIGGDPPASQYNADYALSMWIAVNPGGTASTSTQMPNGVEAPVFSYGTTTTSYKPCVRYDVGRDVYNVEVAPNKFVSGLRVANQKWNQFVFNYNIATQMIDIYINGQLAHSTPMSAQNPIKFDAADQFTVGGSIPVYGSVGNVTYYPHSLTPYQIAQLWNTHTALNLNPPESALKYPSTGIYSDIKI